MSVQRSFTTGLIAALTIVSASSAEAQIKPRFVVILDSSGSMHQSVRSFNFPAFGGFAAFTDGVATHGDGSDDHLGCDVDSSNGLTFGRPNDSRMFVAKEAISNVVAAFGEVEFALSRYRQETGGQVCTSADGSSTGCPSTRFGCWNDDNNAATSKVCVVGPSNDCFRSE